ncbi:MAG: hypothetical protein ACOC04_01535 [Halothece sp.]
MARKKLENKLEKLQEDKKQKDEQIKQVKRKIKEEDKKKDTRRKLLIGAYCLSLLNDEKDVQIKDKMELRKKMDQFLTKDSDRELFNLKPLSSSKSSKPKSSSSQSNPSNSKGDD